MDWLIVLAVLYGLYWLANKMIDVFCNSKKQIAQSEEAGRLVREQRQRVMDERRRWEAEHPEEVKKIREAAEKEERFRLDCKSAPWV